MNLQLRTPISVRIREVIEVMATRGAGVPGNPVRLVTQFWSRDGQLLAERDPETATPEGRALEELGRLNVRDSRWSCTLCGQELTGGPQHSCADGIVREASPREMRP